MTHRLRGPWSRPDRRQVVCFERRNERGTRWRRLAARADRPSVDHSTLALSPGSTDSVRCVWLMQYRNNTANCSKASNSIHLLKKKELNLFNQLDLIIWKTFMIVWILFGASKNQCNWINELLIWRFVWSLNYDDTAGDMLKLIEWEMILLTSQLVIESIGILARSLRLRYIHPIFLLRSTQILSTSPLKHFPRVPLKIPPETLPHPYHPNERNSRCNGYYDVTN